MSDNTPTVPFPSPTPPSTPGGPSPVATRSRTLVIVLSIIGGLLLLAVVVLLTLLLSGRLGAQPAEPSTAPSVSPSISPTATPSDSPIAEPTESPDATVEPTETSPPPPPPPPATGPVFTAFSPSNNQSVGCADDVSSVPLTFTWSSTGATEAAIGVGTTDAFTGPYETGLPPSGSYTNLSYQCSNPSQIYTVSIRGTSGQTNKTVTLKR